MAKKQITDASLVAARQVMNEHLADIKNPHDVFAHQTGAMSPLHTHKQAIPGATFTRASIDGALAINEPKFDIVQGVRVMEGTTNLLPAGAENFVTGWVNGPGETCSVTDYPINIPGIGNVIAKRITGNGAGSSINKYYIAIYGQTNPHTITNSLYAMKLSDAVMTMNDSATGSTQIPLTKEMKKHVLSMVNVAWDVQSISLNTGVNSSVLDVVVYQPQMENKAYYTGYVLPGTTRAAESITIPATVLSRINGTVEFDVDIDKIKATLRADGNYLLRFRTGVGIELYVHNSNISVVVTDSVGQTTSITKACADYSGQTSIKIRYTSSVLNDLWINGVYIGQTTVPKNFFTGNTAQYLELGSVGSSYQCNSYLSNFRISNIARSDEEMAYTGPLSADQYTTFYNPLTGNGGNVDHADLLNKGSNTHAQIDTALTNAANHLSNVTNPHGTTAAQVGAVPNIGISSVDANTLKSTGSYYLTTSSNIPEPYCQVFVNGNGIDCSQLIVGVNTGKVYMRTCTGGGGWSTLKQIYPAVLT